MKKKTVPAILIHLDWIETIKCLSHEQIGAFIIAMLDYANTGKEPKFKVLVVHHMPKARRASFLSSRR